METVIVEKPSSLRNIDTKILGNLLTKMLWEYNEFDIELMEKYFETKDLDESNFINI